MVSKATADLVQEEQSLENMLIFDFRNDLNQKYSLTEQHRMAENFFKYQKSRILVIDDEEFCLTMMRSLLFRNGIDVENQVDFCINGLEGLNQVKEAQKIGVRYKVIFTDFNMPLLDGIEATQEIRKYLTDQGVERLQQPIIVGITGHVLDEYMTAGTKAGMDDIYSKPFYANQMEDIFTRYEIK